MQKRSYWMQKNLYPKRPHHELQSSLIALVLAVAAYAAGAQVPLLTGDDEGAYVLAFQG